MTHALGCSWQSHSSRSRSSWKLQRTQDTGAGRGLEQPSTSEEDVLFQCVQLWGLSARPELNGRYGLAASYSKSSGRYGILLESSGERVGIRPTNLKLDTSHVLVPPHGMLRWLVDIRAWEPSDAEWNLLLGLISEEESTKAMRMVRPVDRKRALLSRLLQRRACFEATGVSYEQVSRW